MITRNTLTRIGCCALVTAGLTLLSATCQASEPALQQKAVSYADLNLDTPQGARILFRRLQEASRSVCREYEGRHVTLYKEWRACYAHALTTAVGQINQQRVTQLLNQSGLTNSVDSTLQASIATPHSK